MNDYSINKFPLHNVTATIQTETSVKESELRKYI